MEEEEEEEATTMEEMGGMVEAIPDEGDGVGDSGAEEAVFDCLDFFSVWKDIMMMGTLGFYDRYVLP